MQAKNVCWYPAKLLVYLLVSGWLRVGGPERNEVAFNMPLTDTFVKNSRPAQSPKKYSDAGGLHLLVTPQGSRLWRWSYRCQGKQKTMALGAYPTISLADARKRRDEGKKQLAMGQDPSEQLKIDRINRKNGEAATFGAIADQLLGKAQREGRADATLAKKTWLLSLARPDIGQRPITEISAAEILVPLRRVEMQGNHETAKRLRAVIGQVFRFAIASAMATDDPTFGLKGALVAPVVTHRPALTTKQAFAGLLKAIWAYEGNPHTTAALKLMAYLYPRPGELRQAEWPEFDLDKAVWTIPAGRTKMRREHRKPLPKAAMAVLGDLKERAGTSSLVFPSIQSPRKPMSENTLNGALRRMGYTKDQVTSHGFRATASTLLNESGKWSADAIEAELAHLGSDEVRRAYHRALYWEERCKMADWWAQEIDALRT